MSDDLENIRKELEEVRKLKEELRREVEDVRREKEDSHRHRVDEARRRAEVGRPARPLRVPKAPRIPRVASVDLNLEDLTDSLETMMDGLGDQIEMSLRSVEGLKVPGIRIRKGRRRTKGREKQRLEIESIAPERVAKIVAPLGSEERLKLLDYLKTGGKSFNEIENHSGRTGSSLTHHLNPLVEAGYVVKGAVRGVYWVTVEGRLAYRLAQWLTHRVEQQRERKGNNGDVDIDFDDDEADADLEAVDLARAEKHLETLAEDLEEAADEVEKHQDELEEARDALEEEEDDEEDLDELDWED
jgi:DNA-binding transcriptional ArsR family regulator